MRVSRQVAAENRERMVGAASRLFRERGFSGVGVDELTREVGLTHGSLYSQFGSKDGLAAQAVASTLCEGATRWQETAVAALKAGQDPFAAIVERYVSPEHRDRAGGGCLLAALAAEAPRAAESVRDSFAEGAGRLLEVLAAYAPGLDEADRRRRALGALVAMIGGIILARTMTGNALSTEILEAARDAALAGAERPGQEETADVR